MILHIAPTPFFSDRGCHIRIEGIVHSLDSLGFDHELCTYHLGYDPQGVKVFRIAPIKGHQKIAPGPSIYKPWANWKLTLLSAKHIRSSKPIALHSHLHEGVLIALLSRLLAFQPSLPIVADMQGSLVGELETYGFFNKLPFLKWPFDILERFILWSASQIVCSSERALDKFAEKYPSNVHKLFLAQDGARAVQNVDSSRLQQLRSQYKLSPNKPVMVYSGALIRSKGLDELQQLLLACKADADSMHFLIIGYPTESLEQFVKMHALQSLCTLTGRLPFAELAEHLALADVAIDTKNSDAGEGSGKMLNYLASGLPVVAFNTLNNAGFLGIDAPLCDSVEDMRQQLLTFAHDEQLRSATAERNRLRLSNLFSWDVTAEQLRAPYQALGLMATCTSNKKQY